jgi:hypothetical protein
MWLLTGELVSMNIDAETGVLPVISAVQDGVLPYRIFAAQFPTKARQKPAILRAKAC